MGQICLVQHMEWYCRAESGRCSRFLFDRCITSYTPLLLPIKRMYCHSQSQLRFWFYMKKVYRFRGLQGYRDGISCATLLPTKALPPRLTIRRRVLRIASAATVVIRAIRVVVVITA